MSILFLFYSRLCLGFVGSVLKQVGPVSILFLFYSRLCLGFVGSVSKQVGPVSILFLFYSRLCLGFVGSVSKLVGPVSILFYFYSRLCPSTAGSSPPPWSSIFLCPLLSSSVPLLVAPQCHLSNDFLVFQLILHPLLVFVCLFVCFLFCCCCCLFWLAQCQYTLNACDGKYYFSVAALLVAKADQSLRYALPSDKLKALHIANGDKESPRVSVLLCGTHWHFWHRCLPFDNWSVHSELNCDGSSIQFSGA